MKSALRNLIVQDTNVSDVWGRLLAEEQFKRMHYAWQPLNRFSAWLLIATCALAAFAISNYTTLAGVLPKDSFPLSLLKYSIFAGFAARCTATFYEFLFSVVQPVGADRLRSVREIDEGLVGTFSDEECASLNRESVLEAAKKHAIERLPFLFRLVMNRRTDAEEEVIDLHRFRSVVTVGFLSFIFTAAQFILFAIAVGISLDLVELEINNIIDKS